MSCAPAVAAVTPCDAELPVSNHTTTWTVEGFEYEERVVGNHATITAAGQSGNFELNVQMPVLAQALLESISLRSPPIPCNAPSREFESPYMLSDSRRLASSAATLTSNCCKGVRVMS